MRFAAAIKKCPLPVAGSQTFRVKYRFFALSRRFVQDGVKR